MAKSSRRPSPGDSAPDFSHLSESDEPVPWQPTASDSAVDIWGDDTPHEDAPHGDVHEESATDDEPTFVSPTEIVSPAGFDEVDPPAIADSPVEAAADNDVTSDQNLRVDQDADHVFFEADVSLDDQELLAGETLDLSTKDNEPTPILEDVNPANLDDPESETPPALDVGEFPSFDALGFDALEDASSNDVPDVVEDVNIVDVADAIVPEAQRPAESTDDAPPVFGDIIADHDDGPLFTTPDELPNDDPNDETKDASNDEAPLFSGPGDVAPSDEESDVEEEGGDPLAFISNDAPPSPIPSFDDTPDETSRDEKTSAAVAAVVGAAAVGMHHSVTPVLDVPGRPLDENDPDSPVRKPAEEKRRKLILILLASYASMVTLAWLFLWFQRHNARPHELESLPDVAPLDANEFQYAPQSASMPRGHTMPLGTSQQLGAIKVEPLRVTRGPVTFTHFSNADNTKSPTAAVMKLWIKFTNVSKDQMIAPLDGMLLFTRSYQVTTDTVLANQLLFPVELKESGDSRAYVLDHPITSDWDLTGQQLGYRLQPGESMETYIPIDPGNDVDLHGDLIWRVHFRKGFHAATGHGVTTIIEVPFNTTDVRTES